MAIVRASVHTHTLSFACTKLSTVRQAKDCERKLCCVGALRETVQFVPSVLSCACERESTGSVGAAEGDCVGRAVGEVVRAAEGVENVGVREGDTVGEREGAVEGDCVGD